LYAANEAEEMRSSQGNWFNRPFAQVVFDGNPTVTSVTFLQESLSAPKDIAWGQQLRATEDSLESFGFNADWELSDRFSLMLDAHTSTSESVPNGPGGQTSYDFGTGAAAIAAHSLDLTSGFPVQDYVYDDVMQNNNDTIDIGDVSSSVGRTSLQRQAQDVDEFRLEGNFAINDDMSLLGGVNYRTSSMEQRRLVTAQILGDWGVTQPGDIEARAPG
jgi:hypothetical protein